MAASRTGNVEAMKVLLDHGADINAKETLRGTTPLMWAADEAHPAAIQLLIERGADFKARSSPAERGRGPALGKANVNVVAIAQGSSELNISLVVMEKDREKAVRLIHEEFHR